MQPDALPPELRQIIKGEKLAPNTVGCSRALVFHLKGLKGYLKIAPHNPMEPLAYEAEVLRWLSGKLPVPEVLYCTQYQGYEYLLFSEIEGADGSREVHRQNPHVLVRSVAEGLKLIHSLEIGDCPLDQTLGVKINKARYNMEQGLVKEDLLEPEYRGTPLGDLFTLLLSKQPANQELVFTHGDYCLPNIILKEGRVSGFIDMGRAGVSDRYVDLALAVRSLRHNGYTAPELWELFFEVYGLDGLDQAKLEFYTLLDEFL